MLSRVLPPEIAPTLLSYCTPGDVGALLATSFRTNGAINRVGVVASLAYGPTAPADLRALEILLNLERKGGGLRWRPASPGDTEPAWVAGLHSALADGVAVSLSLSPKTVIHNELDIGRITRADVDKHGDRLLACVDTFVRWGPRSRRLRPVVERRHPPFPVLVCLFRIVLLRCGIAPFAPVWCCCGDDVELHALDGLVARPLPCRFADASVVPVSEFPALSQLYRPTHQSGVSLPALALALMPHYPTNADVVITALALHKRISEFTPYDRMGGWVPRSTVGARARRKPCSARALIGCGGVPGAWKVLRPHYKLVLDALTRVVNKKWPALFQYASPLVCACASVCVCVCE